MTKIEWTDETWNPTRGCSMAAGSELGGCLNCYAARNQLRRPNQTASSGKPFAILRESGPRWSGEVELVESKLTEPLHWKKPRRVFVNSMSDLFHEELSEKAIDRVFGVMALCPHIKFQILTKRAERMAQWFRHPHRPSFISLTAASIAHDQLSVYEQIARAPSQWPLPNVWLGVSLEDQPTADARIPLLLQTPTALRFVSYEPALGPVDFRAFIPTNDGDWHCSRCGLELPEESETLEAHECPSGFGPSLDWGIVGGESGPQARPCDLGWIDSTVDQFAIAGRPLFVKQVGSKPILTAPNCLQTRYPITDFKGGNWNEWPAKLRVREFPR